MKRALLILLALPFGAALAASKSGDQKVSILPGGDSKAPISIEADRLDYYDKDSKAVYDGHVVVIQGETKLVCSKLSIFMDKAGPSAPRAEPVKADASAPGAADSSKLKHMDCDGPVRVDSKTQSATADSGSYDKARGKVVLSGHVVLVDHDNVTKGDRLVYDLANGQAQVEGGGSKSESKTRIQSVFVPGSSDSKTSGAKKK